MSRKLYIKTFGCQMNEYDSAKTAELLAESHDLVLTEDPAEADVLLVNTCSVREKAAEKVFSQLGKWRVFKEARPDVMIGVGGCVASQEGSAIQARAPFVDVVYGPQTLQRVPELLHQAERQGTPQVDVSFPEIEKFDALPEARAKGPTAFVSVMEGCSKYCSFCVVPYTRGEEFSRPLTDVLLEVADLAEQGVREITYLGQNVNAYLDDTHGNGEADLAALIEYTADVEGIDRIRYTTSHPVEVTDSLIDVYRYVPELVSHLHLPVQTGSDNMLTRMKRQHTVDEYLRIVDRLREARPDLSLSSDFIVGFPGETDADFEDTMALIEEVRFDQSFSFIYSPRPGTPASDLVDEVPAQVKKERLARLQARISAFASGYSDAMVGTVQPVLIERRSKKNGNEIAGRTPNNRVVNLPGPLSLVGQMVPVQITAALPNSLRGRVAASERVADRSVEAALPQLN
ncbi:MAG: tRNA (N6-isopentenyl adenosine(37)-C2)-methylthiotransferase MiaB [Pseudomonadota bacterium]